MPATAQEPLIEDVLFLACTRPAMIAGVPIEAMGFIIIVSATVFLAADSPLYLLIAPVLHLVCAAICRHDHNAFRILGLFVQTKGRAGDSSLWGGSSFTPLPLRRRFAPSEVLRG